MVRLAHKPDHDVLERRIDELSASVDALAARVTALEQGVPAPPPHTCREWSAWHDREPGGTPTLHVKGRCEFPTAGFEVRLERHEPQGFNPRDLLLDLTVTAPTGPVAQVITEVEVHYTEETEFDYDTVTILPDGPTIEVVETS